MNCITRHLQLYGRFVPRCPMFLSRPLVTRNYTAAVTEKFSNRKRLPIYTGQPIHETRPYLLNPGELTPGISALEYYQRRLNVAAQLQDDSCLVIAGNDVQFASGAVFYPFQQDNDLFYLTGWNEPNSVMVIEKHSCKNDDLTFTMFVQEKNAFSEQWEGYRTGIEGVQDIFNADQAFGINQLSNKLPDILRRGKIVYFNDGRKGALTNNRKSIIRMMSEGGLLSTKNYKNILAGVRKVKSEAELKIMRRAGQISGKSYNQAFAKKFRNERTLASFLDYKFISGGCDKSAYIPVVATGSNALCIHYTRNDDVMFDDEMVLVDASGSLGGYCSDISRTWPVSGKFSSPQRDLYQAVLNVQKQCIDLCKSTNDISLEDIHQESLKYMKRELKNLGISDVKNWDVERLYPHYIGHNLGLDVHDVPEASRYEKLKEGQVITIEPGLYIPDSEEFPEYFRNVGIRIEDDIAIGKDSYTNLTVEALKEISDLENVMSNGNTLNKFDDDIISPLEN
ncbi:similar to Saccharomyces cerevisiae YER078C ICP55 Mitochondrial aminopeptidase [Maudiozyma barnettii]|uniref:Similar to Saccharomyces cerevisiae YER078C ICP55 Mitochondrial aminopeptidase n=1 Tax=Maudiozyma barnettii TaxID=61262 RepID=A0A8H2VEE9_9SACH|nr:aminopeptidase [Kazachstania barnettii]CAB4254001.1 similar to Saccharomyces cerevisiae YER078C ICP55 Mitochondrial aminopeptidase [Kazachstania barnettii]CAD1781751.1 similar to Saccharomyces cerevisiae YER078C ICP55 Mitochondrial aminopeptidase [Kazachstania barnettii]